MGTTFHFLFYSRMIKNSRLLGRREVEPRYTSYATWYKYYQELNKEDLNFDTLFNKTFFKSDNYNACFSLMFRAIRAAKEGERISNKVMDVPKYSTNNSGTLLIGLKLGYFKDGENNYCLLSPSAIDEWCNAFTDIVNYKATVILSDPVSPDKCIVELDFPKTSYFGNVERFLATWVRYLYEKPYNLAVVDTIRLKGNKRFSKYSYLDLFNLVSQTCFNWGGWGEGHSICFGGGIYPKQELKKALLSIDNLELNSICKRYRIDRYTNRLVDMGDMYSASDLMNFKKRLPDYKKMILKFEEHLKKVTENEEILENLCSRK